MQPRVSLVSSQKKVVSRPSLLRSSSNETNFVSGICRENTWRMWARISLTVLRGICARRTSSWILDSPNLRMLRTASPSFFIDEDPHRPVLDQESDEDSSEQQYVSLPLQTSMFKEMSRPSCPSTLLDVRVISSHYLTEYQMILGEPEWRCTTGQAT